MNLLKTLLITFILTYTPNLFTQFDHVQDAHKHVVKEAWNLLKVSYPVIDYFEMKTWMIDNGNNGPWYMYDKGRILAGAYREDDEDLIYNYTCWNVASSTHFWKVRTPDNPNEFGTFSLDECLIAHCNVPASAWNRLELYKNGGWIFKKQYTLPNGDPITSVTFNLWEGGTYEVVSFGPIGMRYQGLITGPNNLYETGYMEITGRYVDYNGTWENYNPPLRVRLGDSRKYFVYEIFGRMTHCLVDQSVPAHTHLDAHPDGFPCYRGDSYETRMDGQYQNYTAANTGGQFVNPYGYGVDPVFYLAFTMNQIASRFPSNDADGESEYNQPPLFTSQFLNGAPFWDRNIFSQHGENGISQSNFETIAHYCMKNAIRLTAGLLYWFTVETGQTANSPPNITNVLKDKPDYNVFWNEKIRLTSQFTGTQPMNFAWEYRRCGSFNGGCQNQSPLPNGLQLSAGTSNSYFEIANSFGVSCPNLYNCYQNTNCTVVGQYPNCENGILNYSIKLTAVNDWGSSQFQFSNPIYPRATFRPPPSGGGGCPFVYVWNSDSTLYMTDNNLLHRSEFDNFANVDITDKYKLQIQPNIINGKFSIQIAEHENDHDYIDMVKLYAVDHPLGTKIAVTEHNDIVMYDTTIVQGPDDANRNGTNITANIQYYYQGKLIVSGNSGDNIYAHYDSSAQSNAAGRFKKKYKNILNSIIPDSMALLGNLDREPIGPKGIGGVAYIFIDPNNHIDRQFAMRENMSEVVIPFSNLNDAVDHVEINWQNDYSVSYFAVVPIAYSGFTLTELSMNAAIHSINNENVTELLTIKDLNYAEMDSSDYITMMFDSIPEPENGWVRDFIIETNGRYTVGNSYSKVLNLRNNNITSNYSFTLHNNYPNPFNPKTVINYDIGTNSFVKVSIYNLLGQLIQVLVNESKVAGQYSVEFDGSNLPSGLYIYKIEAGDYIESKKMLLIK